MNTFDTLTKYYNAKDKEENNDTGGSDDKAETKDDRALQCKICHYETVSQANIKQHVEIVHGRNTGKKCGNKTSEDVINNSRRASATRNEETIKGRRRDEDRKNERRTNKERNNQDWRNNQNRYQEEKNNERRNGDRYYEERNKNSRNNGERKSDERKQLRFCIFWNRGYCKFGSQCEYVHEESPSCFYQDQCNRKDVCRYFHADMLRNSNSDYFLDQTYNTWRQK